MATKKLQSLLYHQHLWHADELFYRKVTQHNYIWGKYLSALNFSNDPLVNKLLWLFVYFSPCLLQWLSDSWHVPYWMYILQPHIIWYRWVIFRNFGRRSNRIPESLIWTSIFSSYAMECPEAYFLACLYVVCGQILGESLYDVVQY